MEEFLAIADDFTAWQSVAGGDRADEAAHADQRHDSRFAQIVQMELRNTAVLLAVTASAANALERDPRNRHLITAIVDFCPLLGVVLSKTTDRLDAECANGPLRATLQEYGSRLQFAQTLSHHLVREAWPPGILTTANVEILSDAWRRVCTACLQLNSAISDATGAAQDHRAAAAQAWAVGLVQKAEAGGAPGITHEGQLEIPGWAERRRDKRVAVQRSALASIGTRTFAVTVLNASATGLGLSGDAENGQNVIILLADGRQISGAVQWTNSGQFGLRLDVPLQRNDPLLGGM